MPFTVWFINRYWILLEHGLEKLTPKMSYILYRVVRWVYVICGTFRYNRNQLQAINHDFGWPTNIYGIQKKSIHVFEKSVRWVYVICGTFIALTCYVFPQCRMLKKDFINRGCFPVLQKGVHDQYSLQWFLNILYNVITIYTLECVIKYFVIIRL